MTVEAAEIDTAKAPALGRFRLERRRTERHSLEATARYERLWTVRLVDVGPAGLRVESELPFRFGPGRLCVGAGPSPLSASEEVSVTLIWSRLVATEKGAFGEICPRFHSGLAVLEPSGPAWRRALRGLSRNA